MISLDTETCGIDFWHGARPFFVTSCNEAGEVSFWEWPVDPLTRRPEIPQSDIWDIAKLMREADRIVLQNAKFDAHAMWHSTETASIRDWPWDRTHDTLIAGHLLASNHPHDLTSMAMEHLGIDILPLEVALEKAVKEARSWVRRHLPEWRIAKRGEEDMPSAKEKTWKYDSWLPKALMNFWALADDPSSEFSELFEQHEEWNSVLAEYANADSSVTLKLWQAQEAELRRRDLWAIYLEKMKNLSALFEMEEGALSLLPDELSKLKEEYREKVVEQSARCVAIAAEFKVACPDCGKAGLFGCKTCGDSGEAPYALTLPKGSANNRSLTEFAFEHIKLPVLRRTETGLPSLDKDCIEEWLLTLEGRQLEFVKHLKGVRKRNKSLEFLDAYESFQVGWKLHMSLNPTGTATTRLSCGLPNLQQVSKLSSVCSSCLGDGCEECGGSGEDLHSVRRVFGPAEGREWWTADANNIELRLPAYESGEPELIKLFERPYDPPFYGSQHMFNMSVVYDEVWRDAVKRQGIEKAAPWCKKQYGNGPYHYAKCGGLAMQYQCGEATADRAFRRKGGYRKLKDFLTKLGALNRRWVAYANKWGWVETMPDRTVNPRKGYPLLCARGESGWIVPTTPLNYRVQGSAGWWMIKAVNRCHTQLREWNREGFDGRLALPVHDELIFDFPKHGDPRKDRSDQSGKFRTSNLWRMRRLQRLMEQGGEDIGVPTPVTVEWHPESWDKGIVI
jgi:DNA polymerase I-like protein with 3'-5' exonuclease and polymerase domains